MRLKLAYHENPRVQPLVDGTVKLEGYECDWHIGHAAQLHQWHLTENACDVFEFSISNYIITKDKPERSHLRWVAIPTFLMKAAMWLEFFVHADSGIQSFADLKGKRIGLPDFQMTAGLWMRIVLRELYGIRPEDISWVNGRPPSQTHGEGATDYVAPGIQIRRLNEGESLNDLLQRGEIDGAFGDSRSAAVDVGPAVRQLAPEVGRQTFVDFYAKTGMTPVNHVLLMQERLLAEHPGLPMLLYNTLERSKQAAYERARQVAPAYLLFPEVDFARNAAEFETDPYPPGLAANRRMLQTVIDESAAEGLIRTPPTVDSLFTEATRNT
jgi:4,5-dihydroxyphthalate decarboxylase